MASSYDPIAERFERQRALPGGVVRSVRGAVMTALKHLDRPRLLDVGAGGGRFGWPFVAAGDDYVGVDLSAGMLRVFADRCAEGGRAMLVQADGCALPFPAASFDAVLLIAVFGGLRDWRRLVNEGRRVLRPDGALILGRTVTPAEGVDARMRQHLATLLGTRPERQNTREDAERYLAAIASTTSHLVAASWRAQRNPRMFLDRHAGGARFSRLPPAVREDALRALAGWAQTEFGDLDATFWETHQFDMRLFRFARG